MCEGYNVYRGASIMCGGYNVYRGGGQFNVWGYRMYRGASTRYHAALGFLHV